MPAVIFFYKAFAVIVFITTFTYLLIKNKKKDRPAADRHQDYYLMIEASMHNYGKIGPGTWDKVTWKVYNNCDYSVCTKFIPEWNEQPKTVNWSGSLSESQMKELRCLLSQQWKTYHVYISTDNEVAWRMQQYAVDGRCINSTGDGPEPIFGHTTLEGIAQILRGLPRGTEE